MESVTKVVLYLIPIVFLVLSLWFYYSPERGFEKLGVVVKGVQDYVPQISGFGDKLNATPAEIPPEHSQAVNSLIASLNLMLKSPNKNCFHQYQGVSNLGEYDTSLVFQYTEGKTTLLVYGGVDGKSLITELTTEFEGMTPCVIAGSSGITQNFDQRFLNSKTESSNYFNPVEKITIAYNLEGLNENRIDYGNSFKDFEGQFWLFTPDNKHICFFPTVDGGLNCAGSSPDGLDDNCFQYSDEEGINYQVINKKLTEC